ncbi:hypothetical protein [Neptuniibacter pectenicola]|uniref:hypothetical protein n=1 Tax=Neptuniibacter pectenicola TaxID=1806669 RepID=UPI000834D7BC|nr:hypothetical protein [Neptuniibacter pectenicola]
MNKPATPTTGATRKNNQKKSTSTPTKHELCIHELLRAGTNGINQLIVLNTYHDTCLNTTISELGLKRKLIIEREKRPHINTSGGNSPFCWYWFPSKREAEQALEMLNQLRSKRGEPHLDRAETTSLLAQYPSALTNPELPLSVTAKDLL